MATVYVLADIENFSSKLNVSLEKAIAEAVVNSIHANASNIDVIVKHFRSGVIEYVEIVDDGEGFTKPNLKSFATLHSRLKKNLGGKGIGRAVWFKFFDCVSIDSVFKSGDKFSHISFDFNKGEQKLDTTEEEIVASSNRTSVKMFMFIGQAALPILNSTLKPFLLREMAIMLYRLNRDFQINLVFQEGDKTVSQDSIRKRDLPIDEKKYDFDVKIDKVERNFTLHCINVKTKSSSKVETGFVAGERTVSNFQSTLGLNVKSPTQDSSGQYWLLLESQIFNDGRFVSDDRETVSFPSSAGLVENDVKSEIKRNLADKIREYFDSIAPELIDQRNTVIREIIELYPHYADQEYQHSINELTINQVGWIDKYQILKKLHDDDFQKEYSIKNELNDLVKSKNIDAITIERIIESAKKTSQQAKNLLSDYFWYRKAIIDQLEKLVADKEKSEDILHELFYKRYKTTRNIDFQNCIWLLDDKFMKFSFFASEGIIKNVITDIYGEHEGDHNSGKRCDIFMAFDRDIKEESEKRDCVLIEFKALGATRDKKADASSQVRRKYARSIKKFAPNVRNIFIYIITDIDDELKEDLISDDYKEAITRYGTMMNYYNPANEAHICFLCARTIIGDAKDRHDLFFKILDEELAYKQRAGIENQISEE